MKLTPKEPRMIFASEFDYFHKLTIGRHAAEDQSGPFQGFAKLRIKFETMAVPLADFFGTINILRQRALRKIAGPGTQPHRSTEVLNVNEISELENNWLRRLLIKLGRIRILQSTDILRKLDTGR